MQPVVFNEPHDFSYADVTTTSPPCSPFRLNDAIRLEVVWDRLDLEKRRFLILPSNYVICYPRPHIIVNARCVLYSVLKYGVPLLEILLARREVLAGVLRRCLRSKERPQVAHVDGACC